MTLRRPLGSVAARLLAAIYPFAATYYALRARCSKLRAKPAVMVYQMGKVGSSTIRESLRASDLSMPVYSVHTLTPEGIAELEAFYRSAGAPMLPRGRHLLVSRLLLYQLQREPVQEKWKIVTLVRDPIARNVSLLFQQGALLLPDFEERCRNGSLNLVELSASLERDHPTQVDCLTWFDRELKRVFGVDIYASAFPRSAGYNIYRTDSVDVLLLKLEHLNACAGSAFQEFLHLDRFSLKPANIGRRKDYAEPYERFLKSVTLPEPFVERFYSSTYMRHLYSDDEIDSFRNRWLGSPRGDGS